MGFLKRLLAPQAATWGPFDDRWYHDVGWSTQSATGLKISPSTAMSISVVFACARVLAETVGVLPLPLYEQMADGGKRHALQHPLYDVIHSRPNSWQTSQQFREMLTGHLALRGNAYARIVPGPRGFADQLVPLHPDQMRVDVSDNNRITYRYREANGQESVYGQDEIFHLATLSDNGVTGLSIVTLARESMGLAAATEQFGARLFSQGATQRGILKYPGKLSKEARGNLKAEINEDHSGLAKAHQTMILQEGMEWQSIQMTPEDSQFLETRKHQVTEIARWFRMQPHMIGDLEKATYSNVEHQGQEFVSFTMMPWFVRWEQSISRDLLLAPERYYAKFQVQALLRGDTVSRYNAYQSGITAGWLTRNEARAWEDLDPLPGLDEPLHPANITGAPQPGEPPPPTRGPGKDNKARQLATDAAARMVRREMAAIRKQAPKLATDHAAWQDWVNAFYREHRGDLAADLKLGGAVAQAYCDQQVKALVTLGPGVAESWERDRPAELAELMLGGS